MWQMHYTIIPMWQMQYTVIRRIKNVDEKANKLSIQVSFVWWRADVSRGYFCKIFFEKFLYFDHPVTINEVGKINMFIKQAKKQV